MDRAENLRPGVTVNEVAARHGLKADHISSLRTLARAGQAGLRRAGFGDSKLIYAENIHLAFHDAPHNRHEVAFDVLNTPVLGRNLSAFE